MTIDTAAPRRRPVALFVAVGLAGAVGLSVANGRRVQNQRVHELSSPVQEKRDATVKELMLAEDLTDVLTATQNTSPDADKDEAAKAQNAKSLILRQNASASAQRVVIAGGVPDDVAFSTLFALRKDADGGVKGHATDSLVFLGQKSPENLQVLVKKLGDGDPDARGAAGDALAKIGGDTVAKSVDALVKNSDEQDTSLSVSGKLGDAAVPYAVRRLSDPDMSFRAKMAELLGTTGSATAIPALIDATKQENPIVRRAALLSLSKVVQANYAAAAKSDDKLALLRTSEPTLIAALSETSNDARVRSQAGLTLGRFTDPQSIQTLTRALGDDDNLVRLSAVAALQSSGLPAVGPLLALLNGGGNETSRALAAQALGGIGAPEVAPALSRYVSSVEPSATVRQGAVIGLGRLSRAEAVPALVASLEDPDVQVSGAAGDALLNGSMTAAAIPPLIAEFSRPAPAAFNASRVLARMGIAPTEALKTAVASPNPEIQTWAAITLGESGTKDASVAALLETLRQSRSAEVQYAAGQALVRLSEG
ncbi:hypothetical protein CCAX7_42280 [Capsulimonas corticalis]|uniref:Uncharacterized protein n=1 Tax=Capsulimonas corticalis TaxID=2219043 RepID=A0A402CXU9_9BACT|nr:HEAT repeat domain-containing protein [Capsulimonas corticalis]BDI32177.1 hypothetical protein CCAX7_42280 [Capsulimonas corticalis]